MKVTVKLVCCPGGYMACLDHRVKKTRGVRSELARFWRLTALAAAAGAIFTSPSKARAECLAAEVTIPASAATGAQTWTNPIRIEVPSRRVADYLAKGLVPIACPLNLTARTRYRDEICRMSEFGNAAVQAQFTRYFLAKPATLCADAEVVLGRWPGHRSQNSQITTGVKAVDPPPAE